MEEVIAIFIDGSNLYHNLKNNCIKPKIDFQKFIDKLAAGRKILRTYYYISPLDQKAELLAYKKQQQFFNTLRKIPYFDLKLGRLEKRRTTYVEKGIDVNIAVDMIKHAHRKIYSTAILVNADADFVSAIEFVKELGCHVEVANFGKAYHLNNSADKTIIFDKYFFEDCYRIDR